MIFEYEVGKTYLALDASEVEIISRSSPVGVRQPTPVLVYGVRRGEHAGYWYNECSGNCVGWLRASLTQQPVPPTAPLVFEKGKYYTDSAGTVIRILLIREAAEEMVGEVEGKPSETVRTYKLNGKSPLGFAHLVAAVPAVETATQSTELGFNLGIVMSYGSFRLTPLSSMTPYQSLLLCNLLLAKSEARWLGVSTLDRIYKATREHWTSAMSC